jgi:ABC-type uncharacterized transport system involved in gliding motility auxiliary subunit
MNLARQSSFKILALVAVSAVLLISSQLILKKQRIDLTDQGLYSLSQGTLNIVSNIEQPIKLSFFYSDKATADLIQFRAYAQRVKELLQEYESISEGRIQLSIIDPEPFSEDEDRAVALGLQGVPVQSGGDEAYFGLAAENATGKKEAIAFFQPSREAFLEYEISQLLYRVQHDRLPTLGVLTDLDVSGGYDMRTGQPKPAWMVFNQLEKLFQIEYLDAESLVNAPKVDVLLIIQPDALPNTAVYAIDQYVVQGGHTLVFQDPYYELGASNPMGMRNPEAPWPLEPLYEHWGIEVGREQAVVDKALAMVVSLGGNRPSMRHGGLLAIEPQYINPQDVASANLEKVTFAAAGYIKQRESAKQRAPAISQTEGLKAEAVPTNSQSVQKLSFEALISSSDQVMLKPIEAFRGLKDPSILYENFKPIGSPLILAARLSGPITSAFKERPEPETREEEAEDALAGEQVASEGSDQAAEQQQPPEEALDNHHTQGSNSHVMLVADVDILTDRMWVEVQEIFGQRVAAPWADNGAFVTNAIENLSGNADLISIRSRGQYTRPFEVVQALQRAAEERFLQSEQLLKKRLIQTEEQLAALEEQRGSEGITLTEEQVQAIEDFQQEKLKIRKELRLVRRELDKDIEQLQKRLKVVNIATMPVGITLIAILIGFFRRQRRYRRLQTHQAAERV